MSYLDRWYPGRKHSGGHLVWKEAMDVAVSGAAGYGFGFLQNKYREKAAVWGVPLDLFAGVGLTGMALLGDMYGMGDGLTPIARDIGQAGIVSFMHTLGAGHGAQSSGVKRLLISEGDVAKAKAALPNATILGEIPKRAHGDILSAADLAEMAR